MSIVKTDLVRFMFRASLSEAGLFKSLMTSISTVVDDAIFTLNKKGISLKAIDQSRVVVVNLFISELAFEEYACTEDEKICLSIGEVQNLLKSTKSREPIDLFYKQGSNQFEMKIFGEYERYFKISTLNIPQEEEVKIPEMTYNTTCRLTSKCFRALIEDISSISEELSIKSLADKIIFSGTGEMGEADLTLNTDSESLLNLSLVEPSESKYHIKLLLDVVKGSIDASDVSTIDFSTHSPIRIDFNLPNESKLVYYLAPLSV